MRHFFALPALRLTDGGISLARALTLLIGLTCAMLILSTVLLGWNARQEWLGNDSRAMENLAYSLAQHADATFSQTDTVVLDVIDRIENDGSSEVARARVHKALDHKIDQQQQLAGLFVLDAKGQQIAAAPEGLHAGKNLAERDYFKYHRDHASRAARIGVPERSQPGGQWVIPLSRRVQDADGRFAGVVAATISVGHFSAYHQRFSVGEKGLIGMNLISGELVARRPDVSRLIGTSLADTELFRNYLARFSNGTVTLVSPLDGIERQYAYRRLAGYPLVVLAAKPVHDSLAGWRVRLTLQSGFVLAIICVISLGGSMLVRQVQAQTRAKKQIKEAFAKVKNLEQALDEHAILAITDINHKIIYANDRFCSIAGFSRDELLGQDPGIVASGVHPAAFMQNIRDTIAAGQIWRGDTCNRAKNGSFYWTSSTVVPFLDDDGVPYQYVAIRTDITAQKQAEEQLLSAKAVLQESNAQLVILNSQDALTGVANRRRFDQALAQESTRLAKAGMPLALLMIDVDYFKTYNDRYGHPAGDDCLRKVARVLQRHAKRPGDLVARYGGEEFAILLSNTDHAGARLIAEEVRAGLMALGLTHEDNPAGVVTVSVGLHTATAGDAQLAAKTLVERADNALYAAKAAGRNMVCHARNTEALAV